MAQLFFKHLSIEIFILVVVFYFRFTLTELFYVAVVINLWKSDTPVTEGFDIFEIAFMLSIRSIQLVSLLKQVGFLSNFEEQNS